MMVRLIGLPTRKTNSSHASLSPGSAQRQTTSLRDRDEYRVALGMLGMPFEPSALRIGCLLTLFASKICHRSVNSVCKLYSNWCSTDSIRRVLTVGGCDLTSWRRLHALPSIAALRPCFQFDGRSRWFVGDSEGGLAGCARACKRAAALRESRFASVCSAERSQISSVIY